MPSTRHDERPSYPASLPELTLVKVKKTRPGISTFASRPSDVGDYLRPLIDAAIKRVPANKLSETPIFVMATAGMRLVHEAQRATLLEEVCSYLRQSTEFHLPDCSRRVQVISGETEGLYGWLAANYLLGGLDTHPDGSDGVGQNTYGFLDMGGASTQIVFAPNATEAAEHWNDLKLVRLRNIDGTSKEYKVFSTSFLGFGAHVARQRFVEALTDRYSTQDTNVLPDPCMPDGLRTTTDGNLVTGDIRPGDTILEGTGDFEECLRLTFPLLRKDAVCEDAPCLFNGQHAPAIDFDTTRFVGVSEYWHVTHGVFSGSGSAAYDLASYRERVDEFCNQSWPAIEQSLLPPNKNSAQKLQDAQEACFKASWLINVLYEGIGVPMVASHASSASSPNISQGTGQSVEDGAAEPFVPVNKIHGTEFSWTLGTMLVHASGQIPSSDTSLPVGLGSTVSGIVADFEPSGSPQMTQPVDEADVQLGRNYAGSRIGIMVLILVGVALSIVLLCSRDKRRSLIRKLTVTSRLRRRSSGRGVMKWVIGFSRRLFKREPITYERIVEEGAYGESGFVDIGEDDSDDSRSQQSPSSLGLRILKESHGRIGEGIADMSIDRSGLVVRTDSRDRLTSAVQMQNMGRRSRTGSPTR